ncbi:hypothetical protein FO521_21310 [Bacillus pseudomycoides]|nr:hypothetical protein [Bacillus pseudomycoides]
MARSESQDVGAPDREALFASSERAKRPEILAARAGQCFRRILRREYYCPLMRNKRRVEVTPVTGKRLMEAQRITAGYIHL